MNHLALTRTLTTLLAASAGALSSGCGGDEPEGSATSAILDANSTPADVGDLMTTTEGPFANVYDSDPPFEVRINQDAAALTSEVLPELSDTYGLDELELTNQVLESGTAPQAVTLLMACHNQDAEWELEMRDPIVRAEIRRTSLEARFDSGRRIFTDVDMPHFELELELRFHWPVNVGGWYCDNFGTDHDVRVQVNVEGVVGELDVTLGDGSDGAVSIESIDDFALDVDSVTFDSSFLTAITNLGLSVANLFGTGCSTLTSCVNNALDENLSGRSTIQNALKDAMNDALAQVTTIEGGLSFGNADLDYSVGLTSVTTNDSKDRLRTKWDVDFSSNAADAPCASRLTRKSYFAPTDLDTGDEVELVVPFKKLSDLLYTVAKQGDLCAPFVYSGRTGSVTVAVKPVGSFSITPTTDEELVLNVPVSVEASFATVTSAISGELEITALLQPVCGGGFQLVPTDVDLLDLTGTMSAVTPLGTTVTMSATTFINSQRAAAEAAILNALLPGVTVLPSTFGLGSVGKYVSIGDVVYDDAAMTIGLNLLDEDPYCD